MKIQFYLRFHTEVGQELFITGNHQALGEGDREKAFPLSYMNTEFWHGTLELETAPADSIHYNYLLKYDDGTVIAEWGHDRSIQASPAGIEEIQVVDTWNHAGEFENTFFSAPFQKTLLRSHTAKGKPKAPKSFTHVFKVKAPLLGRDEQLCLTGSGVGLGDWDTDSSLLMHREGNW